MALRVLGSIEAADGLRRRGTCFHHLSLLRVRGYIGERDGGPCQRRTLCGNLVHPETAAWGGVPGATQTGQPLVSVNCLWQQRAIGAEVPEQAAEGYMPGEERLAGLAAARKLPFGLGLGSTPPQQSKSFLQHASELSCLTSQLWGLVLCSAGSHYLPPHSSTCVAWSQGPPPAKKDSNFSKVTEKVLD